jgi:hypothetical protein
MVLGRSNKLNKKEQTVVEREILPSFDVLTVYALVGLVSIS